MESFIPVASDHYYPIQNLPYSAGKVPGTEEIHCLSRIGDYAIDLTYLESKGFFQLSDFYFNTSTLNKFMSQDRSLWQFIRKRLQELLSFESSELKDYEDRAKVLIPVSEVTLVQPVNIGDYTDFYSSKYHAYNVGVLFRGPENPLSPNWTKMPIGYHGRSSSVVIDRDVIRPRGQVCPPGGEPQFSVCKKLDYEVEIGVFIGGKTNQLGHPIEISNAFDNIFGLVLLNDWSARDIQAWEYVPLGPFNGKNFMTSISPWIVTLEALQPFVAPLSSQSPAPFPYLCDENLFTYDISLKTYLQTPNSEPFLISTSNMQHLYWSITQQIAHHTVTGCNFNPGDLLGTGTISGPYEDSLGCLLEISLNGKKPLELPNGEKRSFLEDGDTLIIVGEAKGNGFTVGFELFRSKVLPAIQSKHDL